jgi:hypothetical protein
MTFLNQVDYVETRTPVISQDPNESILLECGRLIHAEIINKTFLNKLLTDPLRSIEEGFFGEKFAFSYEEKKKINLIQANSLSEFSKQLLQAIECACISSTTEFAYAKLD